MFFKNTESFLEICRLCLIKGPILKSVFDYNQNTTCRDDTVEKISKCLNVKIREEDEFSKQICENCSINVEKFYEFWNNTNHAQELLKNLAKSFKKSTDEVYFFENINEKAENKGKFKQKNSSENIKTSLAEVDNLIDKEHSTKFNKLNIPLTINNQQAHDTKKLLSLNTKPILINNQSLLITQNPIIQTSQTQSKAVFLLLKRHDSNNSKNSKNALIDSQSSSMYNNLRNSSYNRINSDNELDNNQPSKSDSKFDNKVLAKETILEKAQSISERGLFNQPVSDDIVCEYCGRYFERKSRLEIHRRRHTGERPFKCDFLKCDKAFSSKTTLSTHKKYTHTDDRPFNCPHCSKTFKRKGELVEHLKTQGQRNYHCDMCKHSTFSKTLLEVHKKKHKNEYTFICNICGKGFYLKYNFETHMHMHKDGEIFSCTRCNETFTNLQKLHIHWNKIHKIENDKITCNECGKIFSNKRTLKVHVNRDHYGLRYHCHTCGFEVTSKTSLINHLRTHSGEKPYKCNVCKKRFISCSVLRQHNVVHTRERKYRCTICDKKYSQKSSLNSHKKKAHPVNNYTLLECKYCGINFNNKKTLNMHKDRIHKENEYKCYECGLEVKNRASIVIHLRKHTGEKPFQCYTCKKRFISRKILNLHNVMHSGKRKYICTICNKKYLQKSSLDSHIKQTHPFINFDTSYLFNKEEITLDDIEIKEEINYEAITVKEEFQEIPARNYSPPL